MLGNEFSRIFDRAAVQAFKLFNNSTLYCAQSPEKMSTVLADYRLSGTSCLEFDYMFNFNDRQKVQYKVLISVAVIMCVLIDSGIEVKRQQNGCNQNQQSDEAAIYGGKVLSCSRSFGVY